MNKDFSGQVERVLESQPGVVAYHISLDDLRRTPKPGTRCEKAPKKKAKSKGRCPAQVAQMLALAHSLQDALDRGEVKDQAELAAKLGYTSGRVTKILDLALLAPDIQEEVLFMESKNGEEPITEKTLAAIARKASWDTQRKTWRQYWAQQK